MKSPKAAVRSFKNLVVKINSSQAINPNTTFGVTIIPEGSSNVFVALPNLQNTYTYNIINSDEMSGNITLNTSAGASLRGLVLNTVGGLSIDKIETGAASITMESDNADGSYISLLSNGNYWYMWSVVSGGSISTGNVVEGEAGEAPAVVTTYADVTVNANPVNTVSFPAPQLVARHVLTYEGTAEANATITITTVATNGGTAVNDFTVTASAIGEWSASFSNILNGTYEFTFTDLGAPVGSGVVSAASDVEETDVGPLSFTTPTSFDLDPGEVFDFAAGASAAEPDGTPIAVTTVSSDFNGKTHGQTFNIVYSFTYLGTAYSRTVSGLVADDTPPSKPVISSATFDAVNLDELTVTGTTDIGTTLKLYKDITYLGEATVNGAGAWTFTTTIGFNQTFNLTAQANDSATPIVGDNRSFPNYSALSDPTVISLNTPTLVRPTLLVTAQQNGVFTNATNDFALTGTTAIGSTITLFNGSTQIAPESGPTVDGAGGWTAAITATNESINSLTAKATKTGSNENTSSTFSLNVDRVAPAISGTPLGDLTVYLGNIGNNNDSIPTATDFSSATVTSDWSTQVDAADGAKTVTYTATDDAGNIATTTRTVNVSTEVIIPAITTVVDNEDGTATITGTVTGTYADNLTVQIVVDGSNNGSPVDVDGGTFTATITLADGTYQIQAKTVNSVSESSTLTTAEALVMVENVVQSSFIEDIPSVIARGGNENIDTDLGIYDDNSSAEFGGMLVLLKDDGILQYDAATNETVNDEFTISWWMNLDTSQAASNLGLAGINVSQVNGVVRRFAFDLGNGALLTNPHFTAYTRGPNTTNNLSTGVSMAGVWTHVAIVIRNDSSNTVASFFLNGNKLSNSRTEPLGTKFFPPSTHQTFIFGAGFQGNSVKGLFDSMQIADGTALTHPQVAAIAGQSDRLMTIATAAAVVDPFIENSSDFTLFGASSLFNNAGNLIYNHGTTGTGNYATGKWSDGLTHDGSGFSYTSYTLSFWVKFNGLPADSQDVFFFSARDANHNGLEFMMDTAGGGEKTLQVYHSDTTNNNATRSLTNTYTSSNAVTAFQNVWINFVAVVSNNDENLNVYINESLRRTQTPNGYSDTRSNSVKYVNDITDVDSTFTIGVKWDGSNDHTIDIEIDSIQIAENVILTEAQANAIATDSTRQKTIADAVAENP